MSMDSQKLSQAAEALIKAAAEHTQETQTTLSKEAVAELKRVAAASEKATTHLAKLESDMGDMGASSKATAARLAKLESDLAELKVSHEAARQLQTLQWAITNAEAGQFQFKEQYYATFKTLNSGAFVRDALLLFGKGDGLWIPDSHYVGDTGTDGRYGQPFAPGEAHRQAFHAALSDQIFKLTGVQPRIVKEMNGSVEQYCIYRQ